MATELIKKNQVFWSVFPYLSHAFKQIWKRRKFVLGDPISVKKAASYLIGKVLLVRVTEDFTNIWKEKFERVQLYLQS